MQQAIFLAALAVENGLKAAIAGRVGGPPLSPPSGKLPDELLGHDLVDLAKRAAVDPLDSHEGEALKRGQNYIEWLGRYPSTQSHKEQHTCATIDVGALFKAYGRLFVRCAEEAQRRRLLGLGWSKADADREAVGYGKLFAWSSDGVDPLPHGIVVQEIEVGRMGNMGIHTWTTTGRPEER